MKTLEDIQGSRIYGRRHGKPLKKASAERFERFYPQYSIDLGEKNLIDLSILFDNVPKAYWLEIGFGKGEHLVAQAKENPEIGFIGCEPFINGVSGLIDHMVKEDVTNIRFFMDDARLLMDSLPENSLSRAFILFPDPWRKKRHYKRRVVNAGNLAVLSKLLKSGSELRIGTDHHDYCRWILARLLEHPDFSWQSDTPDDWNKRPQDWPETRYEKKAREAGRESAYLSFLRHSKE